MGGEEEPQNGSTPRHTASYQLTHPETHCQHPSKPVRANPRREKPGVEKKRTGGATEWIG